MNKSSTVGKCEESFFCEDWIIYSLKPHLYSSTNRLSGWEPAHTASVLLQAGPPETSVFSGSYCKWKHLAPTINFPPDWCHTGTDPQVLTDKLWIYILTSDPFGISRRQEVGEEKAVALACSQRGRQFDQQWIRAPPSSPSTSPGLTLGSHQDKNRLS